MFTLTRYPNDRKGTSHSMHTLYMTVANISLTTISLFSFRISDIYKKTLIKYLLCTPQDKSFFYWTHHVSIGPLPVPITSIITITMDTRYTLYAYIIISIDFIFILFCYIILL